MQAVLVSTKPGVARVTSSLGAAMVAVDSKPNGQLNDGIVEINDLAPGIHDLALGQGKDLRKMSFEVGSAPALDAIFYSDRAVGSMLVQTGEDDAEVYLDGQLVKRKTQHGQLRIPNLGTISHKVRVVKDGFTESEEQRVDVVKGQEARIQFVLTPLRKVSALALEHMPDGMQVSLDGDQIGVVGSNGTFSRANIVPGDHTLLLVRAGYHNISIRKTFQANNTLRLSTSDIDWKPTQSTLDVAVPANTSVTVMHENQTVGHLTASGKLSLDDGSYTVIVRSPNGSESTQTVALAAGETKLLDLGNLPGANKHIMERWSAEWTKQDQWYQRRGGGFVLYKVPHLAGTIIFTVKLHRGHNPFSSRPRLKWVVNYLDDKNYLLFQIDSKYFYRTEVVDGNKQDYPKIAHNIPGDAQFAHLNIQVSSQGLLHRYSLQDNSWTTLYDWDKSAATPSLNPEKSRSFTDGEFGFYLPGNDDVELSNFSFDFQSGR